MQTHTKPVKQQEDDFQISNIEEEKENKIPTFFNSKKTTETKLKKTAPEFVPSSLKDTSDDFIITEITETKVD